MTKRRIMRSFRIDKLSGVDSPAQEGAQVLLLKRNAGEGGEVPETNTEKRLRLLSSIEGHSHLVDDSLEGGTTSYDKSEGEECHSHPWVRNADGTITIGDSAGHSHDVLKQYVPVSKSYLAENQVAAARALGKKPKDDPMTTKTATIDVDPKEVTKRLEKAEADVALYKSLSEMTDAQREHYGKLDAAGKEAFVKMSAPDRQAQIVVKDSDVVYVDSEGNKYLKSHDPMLVRAVRRADEAEKVAKTERTARETQDLQKRADTDLKFLKGKPLAKVALLRAVATIADEATRTELDELLKSANSAMEKMSKTEGTTAAGAADGSTPLGAHEQLETLAKALQGEQAKVGKRLDFYDAYEAVSQQHPTLAKAARG